MLEGRPKELIQNLTGVTVCTSASRVSPAGVWAWQEGHRQHTPAAPEILQSCGLLNPHCPPTTAKGRAEQHKPGVWSIWQGFRDGRATCGEGTNTRDTCVQAKDTSGHFNKELCNHLKLNWTRGTSTKMFVRLLSLCLQCSHSACQGSTSGEAGPGFSTPVHRERWAGAVSKSSTQALLYTLLTALHLCSIFNSFNPDAWNPARFLQVWRQHLWLFSLP